MSWSEVPIRSLYRRVEESGRPDLPLLSVYREHGVVLREGRTDNHNRVSDDISNYKVVRLGDLALNKMKTWQGSLGVSGFEGVVSPAYFVGRKIANVDDRFMHHLLRSGPMIAKYAARSKGVRPGQWDLAWDEFASIKVQLPGTAEQRAIADYLDTETARIGALIAKKDRLANLLDRRFEDLVSRTLWPGGVETIRLKHLCGAPSSGNRDHQSFVQDGPGVPCLRGLNVRPGRISTDELLRIRAEAHAQQRSTHLRTGDVVIVRSGAAGAAAAVPPELDGSNCVDLVIVRRAADAIPAWLEYVINSREAQEQVAVRQAGAILTHFNATDAGEVRVPRIDTRDQLAAVDALNSARAARNELVQRLASQVTLLREHRQALITSAVTGELKIAGVA